MKFALLSAVCIAVPLAMSITAPAQDTPAMDNRPLVFAGTYTNAGSKGIYAYRFNSETGELSEIGLAAETQNPSFLAFHPNKKYLYVTNESGTFTGHTGGEVTAFAIDHQTGKLRELNHRPSSGSYPCYLAVDKKGTTLALANYGGGLTSFPLQADGSLGETGSVMTPTGSSVHARRQKEPHAHSINFDPSGRYALAADLGLDKILVYKVDNGKLLEHDPAYSVTPPGAGPRHLSFHPSGDFAYVINEMGCTITVFSYDGTRGQLQPVQTVSALPATETLKPEYTGAEVQVHPNGRFVYGSIRGLHSIAVFEINSKTGELTLRQNIPSGGKTPRNFRIDPSGRFLLAANQDSGNIVTFRIDAKTGELTQTDKQVAVSKPVCLKFLIP